MADESKKIILQLEIDQAKSITQIVSLKDQISKLKTEQKDLNLATVEGQKANVAYTAQIQALTKEQRSLEGAVEKTAAGFQFEAGSIAANRAELSKLTAEYKNLANPTAQQTQKIKALSDTLKDQEAAIGNNTRNVGNYKEAFAGLGQQFAAFSPQTGQLISGFGNLNKTLGTVSKGFTSVGGAIKATGIGLLIILLGSLISYFKNTDDGATKLEGIFGAIGIVVKKITGFFAELGAGIFSVFENATSLGDVFTNLGSIIHEQISKRIEGIILLFSAMGDAITALVKDGFEADFNPALKKAADATIQVGTGIENGTDKIASFAQEIIQAAKIAYDYAIKLDAINDAQRDLNVTNAKSDQIVQGLIKQAANKTLLDQERIDILEKANSIEESTFQNQLALDKKRLALIVERNKAESDAINQKLNRDIADEKSEEKKILLRQKALSVNDKLSQEQADLQEKIVRAETSFILLREKNENKIAALDEKIQVDREKAYQEYLKELQDINNSELSLENQRQARIVTDLKYQLSLIGKSDSARIQQLKANGATENQIIEQQVQERIALLEEISVQEIAIEKKLANDKLAALTSEGLKEGANLKEIELQKQQIIEEANDKRTDIERSTNDQIIDINQKANAQIEKNNKDSLAKRKQETISVINTIGNTLNQLASDATAINQSNLDVQLSNNEAARSKELAASAKDKDTQAKVNAKYDKIAAEDQKKSAKNDLTIKEIQVVANAALAVSQALASAPPPLDFVLAAAAGAAAAFQIAAIETQKSKLAKGGIVVGPSHDNGGVRGTGRFGNIEVEGGEFVVNKRATRNNPGLLHHINTFGTTRNLTAGINSYAPNRSPIARGRMANGGQIFDGGMSARQNLQDVQSNINLKNFISDAVSNLPAPVVLVKDINAGQQRNVTVQDRAKVTKT